MSGFNFKTVLNKLFYEETTDKGDSPTPTAEEQEAYAAAVTSDGSDIVEQARQFIINSQMTCDTDELPDISHVLNAVKTAGSGENHELIRRMLQNLMGMNPEDLKQDGLNRRDAILKAIEAVKAQDTTCRTEKADAEKALRQAETDAGATCTQKITEINTACEAAINEIKRQADEQIAALRQKSEEDTTAAKQERDKALESIAEQRSINEADLRKSAQYVEAVEQEGNAAITKLNELLSYIK